MKPRLLLALVVACLAACREAPRPASEAPSHEAPAVAAGVWEPEIYTCLRTSQPIQVDGILSEEEWGKAPYTSDFVDIEGRDGPTPRFRTRARLLWDDTMLFVAVELDDPHLWANLTQRDSVVWHENDFEIFLDPDGDNHRYFEIEVSPRGTVFDLLLLLPYRDSHAAFHEWDVPGLSVGIQLKGTLNDPSDVDQGWTLELGIPWVPLMANSRLSYPGVGERWRMNLTRVAWRHVIEDGRYVKLEDPRPETGRPEDNWVWSPQGAVNMHLPEMWGILEMRAESELPTPPRPELTARERAGWALMNVYYAETAHCKQHGRYTADWSVLAVATEAPAGWSWPPSLTASARQFEASSVMGDRLLTVDQLGRLVERPVAASSPSSPGD